MTWVCVTLTLEYDSGKAEQRQWGDREASSASARLQSDGRAADACRGLIRAGRPSSGDRTAVGRLASDRLGLARSVASIGSRRTARCWTSRTVAEVEPRPTREVESELFKGAEANGYPNDVWTLQRAAEVIERLTGVSYHPAHVWSILRRDLKWSWQRPARRATERNDESTSGSRSVGRN